MGAPSAAEPLGTPDPRRSDLVWTIRPEPRYNQLYDDHFWTGETARGNRTARS